MPLLRPSPWSIIAKGPLRVWRQQREATNTQGKPAYTTIEDISARAWDLSRCSVQGSEVLVLAGMPMLVLGEVGGRSHPSMSTKPQCPTDEHVFRRIDGQDENLIKSLHKVFSERAASSCKCRWVTASRFGVMTDNGRGGTKVLVLSRVCQWYGFEPD